MKFTSIFFLGIITVMPILSILSEDHDRSKILNSSLQTLPLNTKDEELSLSQYISLANSYLEDQTFGHEYFFKLKYQLDYYTNRNNDTTEYYIPELDINYQYDDRDITKSTSNADFEQICKDNSDTDFFYYVIPDKRNSIPDEYVKYDYMQLPISYRQEKVKENLANYECITTSYNPDLLELSDFYNYNHHYNSTGVLKVYTDLMTTYNQTYNEDYDLLTLDDMHYTDVSSNFYSNPLITDPVDDFTEEFRPADQEFPESDSPYVKISYSREGTYTNPDPNNGGEDILFVTDSFGQGMLPYISENFNSIVSLNYYDIAKNPELLREQLDNNDYDRVIMFTYDYNTLNRDNADRF